MALALLHHARLWLQNRFRYAPNAIAIHDAFESSLAEIDTDLALAEARTIIGEADAEGLRLWGEDLAEPRLTGQTDAQYASALQAVYQGDMVDPASCAAILPKYGVTGVLIDRKSPDVFADLCFADVDAWTVEGPPNYAHGVVSFDDWPGPDSGVATQADWDQRCVNATANLYRIKAAGVRLTPCLPTTTPLG
jgi:hypothetical protein